jgi:acetyl-CoA carboxylase biotin carboxylase subunit
MHQDAVIPPTYDSMVAKLIAYGSDRAEAIQRMRRALDTLVIEGIKTTAPLHRRIMDHPDFQSGAFSTKWMEVFLAELEAERKAQA